MGGKEVPWAQMPLRAELSSTSDEHLMHTIPPHQAHWASRGSSDAFTGNTEKTTVLLMLLYSFCPRIRSTDSEIGGGGAWNPFLLQVLCLIVEETEAQSEKSLSENHRVNWRERQHQNSGYLMRCLPAKPHPPLTEVHNSLGQREGKLSSYPFHSQT